ncbi:MAG: hypothetical protein FWC15_01025 [Fibromonadales bacterium]|nr:hypothetical protein [Fibromonadales bacterium]
MKLVVLTILLFLFIFALAVPMKMENEKLAVLISLEKSLADSVSVVRYELSLIERDIDSLSSRNRIDKAASVMGLGMNGVATKITGRLK